MKTVTITFQEQNAVVKKLLECLECAGAKIKNSPNALDEALAEIENGETVKCDDFEDFVKKINA